VFNLKLGFIGAGNMGSALIKGVIGSGLKADIAASGKDTKRLEELKSKVKVTDNMGVVKDSEIVFLCVKPVDISGVIEEVREAVKLDHIIVSIAAGITIKSIESKLNCKIVRVMPNAPSLVGKMAAVYCPNRKMNSKDIGAIHNILNRLGVAFRINEEQFAAVTALSGSGPAFIAAFLKAMTEAAIKQGIDREMASKLAAQTLIGTGKMLETMSPEELITMVASPKGTTEAGLGVMKQLDLDGLVEKVAEATAKRSKELGK
jgi:pyrroline-5-carboxylate reductase